ncbi:MAG: hypothetical protein QNK37_02115 [Acidobacteriota bacterium]|nr:hypothetical protein [Acidobacteriota bacterium]
MKFSVRKISLLLAFGLIITPWVSAGNVMQMNLDQLTNRSAKIFRGTVLDMKTGSLEIGGGTLPTVTYVVQVTDGLKGTYQTVKNMQVAEITMIGTVKKEERRSGDNLHISILPKMPELQVGSEYLLFCTQPSSAGLCTTVGLGQGSFRIVTKNKVDTPLNEIDNLGLFRDMPQRSAHSDPSSITYTDLANEIRNIIGGGK